MCAHIRMPIGAHNKYFTVHDQITLMMMMVMMMMMMMMMRMYGHRLRLE